jgi:signal peptidase I
MLRLFRFFVILFFMYEFFSAYAMKTRIVESSSMAPTLVPKERVIVFPSAYGLLNPVTGRHGMFRAPRRGDIVLLLLPSSTDHGWHIRFIDSAIRYVTFQRIGFPGLKTPFEAPVIKRVVAIPGDTIKMSGFIVQVKSEGSPHFLTEYELTDATYDVGTVDVPKDWDMDMPLSGTYGEIVLGPDEYFVVGDNRTSGADSRFFGAVKPHDIIGRILVRYWPPGRLSGL